jgi:hypothetical protein
LRLPRRGRNASTRSWRPTKKWAGCNDDQLHNR